MPISRDFYFKDMRYYKIINDKNKNLWIDSYNKDFMTEFIAMANTCKSAHLPVWRDKAFDNNRSLCYKVSIGCL